MGDRTGDSFRGWVYALGLCGGCVGVVGVLEFALFDVLVDVFLGGMGCWIVGVQWGGEWGFVGVCFGSGISFLGLHIIYMRLVTASRLVLAGNGGWSTCYLTS